LAHVLEGKEWKILKSPPMVSFAELIEKGS
jgi:hypothetical protein